MIFTLDGNALPLFKKMTVDRDDAIAKNRGQGGQFNADRSYKKDVWSFEFDLFEIEYYTIIQTLYELQFSGGQFFRLQLIGGEYTINSLVFIEASSIVPKWGGQVLDGYTLTVREK